MPSSWAVHGHSIILLHGQPATCSDNSAATIVFSVDQTPGVSCKARAVWLLAGFWTLRTISRPGTTGGQLAVKQHDGQLEGRLTSWASSCVTASSSPAVADLPLLHCALVRNQQAWNCSGMCAAHMLVDRVLGTPWSGHYLACLRNCHLQWQFCCDHRALSAACQIY